MKLAIGAFVAVWLGSTVGFMAATNTSGKDLATGLAATVSDVKETVMPGDWSREGWRDYFAQKRAEREAQERRGCRRCCRRR